MHADRGFDLPAQVQGVGCDTLDARSLGHVVLAQTGHSSISDVDILYTTRTSCDKSCACVGHEPHHGRSEHRPVNAGSPVGGRGRDKGRGRVFGG